MKGKTVLITGTSAGIGMETAKGIAKLGGNIVSLNRNEDKTMKAHEEILKDVPDATLSFVECDLSSFKSVRKAAAKILEKYPKIDVLINNAGGIFTEKVLTEDGFERTYQINHLGHFLLTNLISKNFVEGTRIVNLSSSAHYRGRVDLDNLNGEKSFSGFGTYSNSKLMNVLFTKKLAEVLEPQKITANAVHPGVVRTEFGKKNVNLLTKIGVKVLGIFSISPAKGAQTSIYVATSDEVKGVTGKYFANKKVKKPSKFAEDKDLINNFWVKSLVDSGLKENQVIHNPTMS